MAPQYFSLHPSWDRMYASGMTVREIADFTDRPRSTVHRHLQVQEKFGQDLRAVHNAARQARGPDWPTTHWQRRYKAAQDFYAVNGKLPAAGDDEAETVLATWIRTQRTLHHRGDLPAILATLMDMIPNWDDSPRRTALDDHWRERFHELQDFVAENARLPRYRGYSSERERILGVWLHTQHQARAERRLLQWRLESLEAALPDWRSVE